jgi:hypothetical protein
METEIKRTIDKIEVSIEQVKASPRRVYNAYEWDRKIDRYASYPECKFYYDQENNEYFAIYVADGIRFMQVIMYSSMLSNSLLQFGNVLDKVIIFRQFTGNRGIDKSVENRKPLRENTKNIKSVFYY